MLVIGIMGIVVVLMAIQFKTIKPEYGIMISVVGCAFIFLYSLVRVNEIVEMVERLAGITSVSREYIKIILKITGVTFISEIASDIAKDCVYQAVANQVQIFGKLSVLVISFPVFTELISSIGFIHPINIIVNSDWRLSMERLKVFLSIKTICNKSVTKLPAF